jgi:hypothetical protein
MNRFIIYKASGGLSHNFNGLSLAINVALTQNRILIISMMNHPKLGKGIKFSDLFVINNDTLEYYDEDFSKIPNDYSYLNLSVDDITTNMISTENNMHLNSNFKYYNNNNNLIAYVGNGRNKIPLEIHDILFTKKN